MQAEKSVILESEIPPEAVKGLPEFFERYYIVPNWRLIDRDSYRKSMDIGVQKFFWKFVIPKNRQERVTLYCHLEISQASVEIRFRNLDETDRIQK